VAQGLVNQVEVAMLPVGHTHEDIDQAFRIIANALIRAGFLGTVDQYVEIIATAWTGERQHVQVLSAVHNFSSWLKGVVWETSHSSDTSVNSLVHLKKNRYFKIMKRTSDNAVCLWYKPNQLHEITYPALKDELGAPIINHLENGKVVYVTDSMGIEIFRTLEGPLGQPHLASFPSKAPERNKRDYVKCALFARCEPCEQETGDGETGDGDGDDDDDDDDNDDDNDDDDNEDEPPCLLHWSKLSHQEKLFAQTLGYSSQSWFYNTPRSMTWQAVMADAEQSQAAIALGFTESLWVVDADTQADGEMAGAASTFVPRLDPEKTIASVRYLLDNHRDEWQDPDNDRKWWESWAATHPTRVEDVVDKPIWEWPKPCNATDRNLPAELRQDALTFAETVEYKNVIEACRLGEANLRQNLADYGKRTGKYIPMSKGDFLWVKRDAEGSSDPGSNTPLWCARLLESEDKDMVEPHDDDHFDIEWWGSFSRNILRDSMDHQYKPICCGATLKRMNGGHQAIQYHDFGGWKNCKLKSGEAAQGHGPLLGRVERSQIRLTTQSSHTFTSNGHLLSQKGADVKSRLASVLMEDGFDVSNFISGKLKNATGTIVPLDSEAIWKRAAKGVTDIRQKLDHGNKRPYEVEQNAV